MFVSTHLHRLDQRIGRAEGKSFLSSQNSVCGLVHCTVTKLKTESVTPVSGRQFVILIVYVGHSQFIHGWRPSTFRILWVVPFLIKTQYNKYIKCWQVIIIQWIDSGTCTIFLADMTSLNWKKVKSPRIAMFLPRFQRKIRTYAKIKEISRNSQAHNIPYISCSGWESCPSSVHVI